MNMYSNSKTALPAFRVYPKRKSTASGEASLYLRVMYRNESLEKSLGIKIPFALWDSKSHRIQDNPFHQKLFEEVFDSTKSKIMGAYYMLNQREIEPTLREIMNFAFASTQRQSCTLFSVFENLLLKMEQQLQSPSQRSNILKHHTCLKHLKAFVKAHLKVNDVSFNRINAAFLEDFMWYLQKECGNNHNSTMKMMQIFKKVYRIAIDNRWASHNAFSGKRFTFKEPEVERLSQEEIQELRELNIKKSYLSNTRNLFLFCTYTGMAYIDLQHLRRRHLVKGRTDGEYLIRKKREKTGVEFVVPLFDPARRLLDQWVPGWEMQPPDLLLAPRISNQKYNVYLKELFAPLSMDKRITSHVARHTFATTVTYENGIPLESISKMVGHAKISQTQRYAKATTIKIEKETRELFKLLKF